MNEPVVIPVQWAPAAGVHAFVTTRHGGGSINKFHSFNLALHVGDDAAAVTRNRNLLLTSLRRQCARPALQLQWLQQVHGTGVWHATNTAVEPPPQADALYTTEPDIVLGVLTADCLPVLFSAVDGSEIAVAHAGWRGLCTGVLEATLRNFSTAPAQVQCWLGPAIGPCHFEVGDEVRSAFVAHARPQDQAATLAAFAAGHSAGKWMGDLYQLARIRLRAAGVNEVAGQPLCTVCHAADYYSYRQQATTGRFATVIVRTACSNLTDPRPSPAASPAR